MNDFYKNLTTYLQAKVELAKMDIEDALVKITFLLVNIIIIGFVALMALIFALFGLVFYINHLTKSSFAGFFFLAILLIVSIITYFLMQKVIIKILIRIAKISIRLVSKFLSNQTKIDEE